MKNVINYYYDMYPNELINYNSSFLFDYYDNTYMLCELNRPVEDIPLLEELSNGLITHGFLSHKFIRTKFNELIIKDNNKEYVLFIINTFSIENISVEDILLNNNKYLLKNDIQELVRSDWGTLWSEKIDYLEYQVQELGLNKKIIKYSFNYFVGLAENAISYYNETINELGKKNIYKITHKRIYNDINYFDYFNPLNFVIDNEVRDISEYIKNSFINNKFNLSDLDYYFNVRIVDQFNERLLFSRLLFPTYYFDLLNKVMEEEMSEETLLNVIDNINEYNSFLKSIYLYLNKKNPIPKIDWIID